MLMADLYISCPSHFSKGSGSFYQINSITNQIWAVGMLTTAEVSFLLSLSADKTKKYTIHRYIWNTLYIGVYQPVIMVCHHLFLYYVRNEFFFTSPTHYQVNDSSLLPKLTGKFPFQQWETRLLPSAVIYLILQFQHAHRAVSEFLTCISMGSNFIN